LTTDAELDLVDIFKDARAAFGQEQAITILDRLQEAVGSLAKVPDLGEEPLELRGLNPDKLRELRETPYRIIYMIRGEEVFVFCVVDARRNVVQILENRLVK
jgi:toxin ParE1/3/4